MMWWIVHVTFDKLGESVLQVRLLAHTLTLLGFFILLHTYTYVSEQATHINMRQRTLPLSNNTKFGWHDQPTHGEP